MSPAEREQLYGLLRLLRSTLEAQQAYVEMLRNDPASPALDYAATATQEAVRVALLMSDFVGNTEEPE